MLYTYYNYYLEKFKYNIDKNIFDKIYKYSKFKINSLFNKFNEKDELISISSLCIYLLYFGLNIEQGVFINDLRSRNKIALEKDFHYENSQYTLFEAWKSGCPN